jgi:hypothetical protein
MMRACAAILVAALTMPGCTAPPAAPVVGPDPSDPSARAPAVDYRSTTAPYTSRRPADPGASQEQNWRQRNERAAQPKSEQPKSEQPKSEQPKSDQPKPGQ